MVARPNVDEHSCFVLRPLKKSFDSPYKVLQAAAKSKGLTCKLASEIYGRTVMQDIWQSIWQARVVIADVTERNPNVNYELGICHALGVPTIIITQKKAHVPFDYQHRRYIHYQPGKVGWRKRLQQELEKHLEAAPDDLDRDRVLLWPKGARVSTRNAKTLRGHARSVVLVSPKVPFKDGQRADFFRTEIPAGKNKFRLRIVEPPAAYWRAGFVLAPEDYIREGRADIRIDEYFLFHIGRGGIPGFADSLFRMAYMAGRTEGPKPLQSRNSIELDVRFAAGRNVLTASLDGTSYSVELDPSYFRNLYVLAWADQHGPFRVPVDLRFR